jgi:hypothetical protein
MEWAIQKPKRIRRAANFAGTAARGTAFGPRIILQYRPRSAALSSGTLAVACCVFACCAFMRVARDAKGRFTPSISIARTSSSVTAERAIIARKNTIGKAPLLENTGIMLRRNIAMEALLLHGSESETVINVQY